MAVTFPAACNARIPDPAVRAHTDIKMTVIELFILCPRIPPQKPEPFRRSPLSYIFPCVCHIRYATDESRNLYPVYAIVFFSVKITARLTITRLPFPVNHLLAGETCLKTPGPRECASPAFRTDSVSRQKFFPPFFYTVIQTVSL